MEHVSPETNSLPASFIDATDKLSDINIRWRIAAEAQNRRWYTAGGLGGDLTTLTGRMDKELFGDSKMPRRAAIRGTALTNDTIFAIEPVGDTLETRELSSDECVLHGFAFITILQPNHETVLPALRVESLVDEQTYYFPYYQIESLAYDEQSMPVRIITGTFTHEAGRIEELRQLVTSDDVPVAMQRRVFAEEQQRINGLLRETIDRGYTYEFAADFYYHFQEGEQADLYHDNTETEQLGSLLDITELKGTFIGFSMPLLIQSDVAEMERVYPGIIDPYEPCMLFHAADTNTVYAVPHRSLKSLK